jgi:hypothetical protein
VRPAAGEKTFCVSPRGWAAWPSRHPLPTSCDALSRSVRWHVPSAAAAAAVLSRRRSCHSSSSSLSATINPSEWAVAAALALPSRDDITAAGRAAAGAKGCARPRLTRPAAAVPDAISAAAAGRGGNSIHIEFFSRNTGFSPNP